MASNDPVARENKGEVSKNDITSTKDDITITKTTQKRYLDGGWGWWVVFGSALSHFLIVGTPRSFGIFYEELLDMFEQSASATAWTIALCNTTRMVIGKGCLIFIKG